MVVNMARSKNPAHKIAGFFISIVFLCLLCVGCSPGCKGPSGGLSNRVVVDVNGEQLKASEFANQLADRLKEYDALAVKEDTILNRAKQEVVREFIIRVITEKWAQANNIIVKKEHIDTAISDVRSQYPDDITFRQKLIEEGVTFEQWRERLRFTLLQSLVLKELAKSLDPPSEEEMKSYYETNKEDFMRADQVKLEQVVLRTESDADRIYSEIRKGKKISELAPKFSTTPEGQNDGLLGWIDRGILDIFDEAFDMRAGSLSKVLKSPYGYHVYRVLDKRKAQTLSFTEVKDQIEKRLLQNREQAAYSKWLENQIRNSKVLKDEAFIENIKIETRGE